MAHTLNLGADVGLIHDGGATSVSSAPRQRHVSGGAHSDHMPAFGLPLNKESAASESWHGRLFRRSRLVFVLVSGSVLCLVGFVLLFLPGPGAPVLFAGLTVLASEFDWADRLLIRFRTKLRQIGKRRNSSKAMATGPSQ